MELSTANSPPSLAPGAAGLSPVPPNVVPIMSGRLAETKALLTMCILLDGMQMISWFQCHTVTIAVGHFHLKRSTAVPARGQIRIIIRYAREESICLHEDLRRASKVFPADFLGTPRSSHPHAPECTAVGVVLVAHSCADELCGAAMHSVGPLSYPRALVSCNTVKNTQDKRY